MMMVSVFERASGACVLKDYPCLMVGLTEKKGRRSYNLVYTPMACQDFNVDRFTILVRDESKLTDDEQQHIEFLQNTLLPDLRESGLDATADDFEKCIGIINRLTGKE